MIIVHEDSAPGIDAPEPCKRTLKVLLSPALHDSLESIAAGLTIIPPGGKSDEHEHVEGEMFFVISGKGQIRVGRDREELLPGTAVWAPQGTTHQLVNTHDSVLKVLWVLCPPGRERAILEKAQYGGTFL